MLKVRNFVKVNFSLFEIVQQALTLLYRYNFVTRPSSADGIRGPRHVPYRNSLLTMLLRDSLGKSAFP